MSRFRSIFTSSSHIGILRDVTNGEDTDAYDLERYREVFGLSREVGGYHIAQLFFTPPMRGVVTGATGEIAFLEVEIILFALSAELWMLSVELLKSNTEAISVPAANNHLSTWSRAEHHLFQALISDEVRKDAESVHAHTGESGCGRGPEVLVSRVNFIEKHFVEFDSVTKLESDLSILVRFEVVMDLEGEVNHLLANLYTYKHVEVVEDLGEEFSGAHANFYNCALLEVFLDISLYGLEQLHFFSEKFAHDGVLDFFGVDGVAPNEWGKFFPYWVAAVWLLKVYFCYLFWCRFWLW